MPPRVEYRPDIQGLRALAVSLVVLAHTGTSWMEGGFVGVDVFFVLSGYLITGLLFEEKLATGVIRIGRFLGRRLRRLLPAMLAMLLIVLVFSAVVLTAFEMRMQSRSFPFAAAWLSNFFFAFAERDYFDALQDEDLFLHTWSLGVEEQFYLMWPWLIVLVAGLASRPKWRMNVGKTLLGALALFAVLSLGVCQYLSATRPDLAFYMMPSRIWQFALGAMVYVGMHRTFSAFAGSPRGRSVAESFAIGGSALIIGSGVFLSVDIVYPGWYALLPSTGTALVLVAGCLSRESIVATTLQSRILVWLGDRSYSLYLWHWPLLVLGNAVGLTGTMAGLVSTVALSLVLADLSYRFIEYPFWKGRFKTAIPHHVIAYAAVSIAASIVLFAVLENQVFGIKSAVPVAGQYNPRYDADLGVYATGLHCDTGHFNATIIPCALGNKDGEKLAVLVGDSIGAQWSPLVTGLFADPDWQILVLTKSACAIVDETWYYVKAGGDYLICTKWRNDVLEYLGQIRPDVVFFGSSIAYEFSDREWSEGTTRILERLVPVAGEIVIVPGNPQLTFDGPSCLEDPWRFSFRLIDGRRECEERLRDGRAEHVARLIQMAVRDFSNVHVLDLRDLVCPDGYCAAATPDGLIVFRDNQHVTATFARSLVPAARARLAAKSVGSTTP